MKRFLEALRSDLMLLGVAACGGFPLLLLGVPAGLLTGALLAIIAVALVRPLKDLSPRMTDVGMLLAGALIGTSATPDALRAALHYPASLMILLISLAVTVLVTGLFLVRVGRWSRLDALLGAAPGALSAVMAVAREKSERGGDIAVIQLFRLFILTSATPSLLVLAGAGGVAEGSAPAPPSWLDAAIMIAAAVPMALLFRRLGVLSPMILGSTTASVLLHASGLVAGTLPAPLAMIAFLTLGVIIGVRIASVSRARLVALMPIAIGAFVTSLAIALVFAWPAAVVARVSYGAAFIALAPGGLEVMAMLAVALGLDPLYVGSHHLVRFMAVGFLLPVLAALVARRESAVPEDPPRRQSELM